MARVSGSYPFTIGPLVDAANVSSTTALVVGVSGKILSIKYLYVSVTAACTITIEEETSGTNILKFILPATGGVWLPFDPDEASAATAGKGINILSSTTDVVCARASCWYK